MDRNRAEGLEGIGSVKAAINLFGQKLNAKIQNDSPSRSGELHIAQLDIVRLNESRKLAELEKYQADTELCKARSEAKELALEIKKSNAKAMAKKMELRSLRKLETNGNYDSKMMQELSELKLELSRMKLNVASAMEAKSKAEKEIEATNLTVKSFLNCVEDISKEIEKANEEHVLVELARIEAEREFREIEARRKVEAFQFLKKIETVKEKIKSLQKEASKAKELERKLSVANADLSVLQSEMGFVRAMERSFQKNRTEEEVGNSSLLKSTEAELISAKKELAKTKENGFKLMASMDVVRKEIMLIAEETAQLKKKERQTDSLLRDLNSKLLKAKSKLESASVSEKRAKDIVCNLSSALQQVRTETEVAKKENESATKETIDINLKIQTTESNNNSAEERLQAAMQELEAVKASEAIVLTELGVITERTMRNRASTSLQSSSIIISRSEYEYLKSSAESAKVLADKKEEAAQAWIEALKAEEIEILKQSEVIKKEIEELKIAEEKEHLKIEEALANQNTVDAEVRMSEEEEYIEFAGTKPRLSMRENGLALAATRRVKIRRLSVTPGTRHSIQSPSFTTKRRRKVMPNLSKSISKGSTGNHK